MYLLSGYSHTAFPYRECSALFDAGFSWLAFLPSTKGFIAMSHGSQLWQSDYEYRSLQS